MSFMQTVNLESSLDQLSNWVNAQAWIKPRRDPTLADIERVVILRRMRTLGGHRERVAASLGISTRKLYDRLHSYGELYR